MGDCETAKWGVYMGASMIHVIGSIIIGYLIAEGVLSIGKNKSK